MNVRRWLKSSLLALAMLIAESAPCVTRYVSLSGGHISPYTNWAMASTNIRLAVTAASAGDLILVTNGTYYHYAHNDISKPVEIRSVNGPAATIVHGGSAHRCFYIVTNAALSGFTITGGAQVEKGGGIYATGGALISNCVVRGNMATNYGGGIYVTGPATVVNCTIEGNSTTGATGIIGFGGGVCLENGGAIFGSVIRSNASSYGGAAALLGAGLIRNALVVQNVSKWGGGLYLHGTSLAQNCTVTSNSASSDYGGIHSENTATSENCVIYFNSAPTNPDHNSGGWWIRCCMSMTNAVVSGRNRDCIEADPQFLSPSRADYRLAWDSPCINAGTNQGWMTGAVDLGGLARVVGSAVDIGAYEHVIYHVAKGGSHTPPFSTWDTAATNIPAATALATDYSTVWVSNGSWRAATEIAANRIFTLRSVNGAAQTIIDGAGVRRGLLLQTNALVDGFTFSNGYSTGFGGGVLQTNSGGVVQNCHFVGNRSDSGGGGIALMGSGVVHRCSFTQNSGLGSSMLLAGGGLVINCTIYSNAPSVAVAIIDPGGGRLRNCLIYDNHEGVYIITSNAVVDHCTLLGSKYAGLSVNHTSAIIRNSIVYNNTSQNHNAVGVFQHVCTTPSYGTGCVTNDPVFVDPSNLNFRLADLSPCLDAGTNLDWTAGATDLDGYPRRRGVAPDIGCYEARVAYVRPGGGNTPPYDSWATAATNLDLALAVAGDGWYVRVTNGVYLATGTNGFTVAANMVVHSCGGYQETILKNTWGSVLSITTSALVEGFTIRDGIHGRGGGAYLTGGGVLRACLIESNFADYGAAVYVERSGMVERCVMRKNDAYQRGGGVAIVGGGMARNCLIYENAGRLTGSAYINQTGLIESCTIVQNASRSSLDPGGVTCDGGGTLLNCVVFGNTNIQSSIANHDYTGAWTNCCTIPSFGVNCVATDPLFRNAAASDFRLAYRSPCEHAGSGQPWMAGAVDLDGARRVVGTGVDIGAYESQYVYVAPSGADRWPYATWSDAATSPDRAVTTASATAWMVLVTNGQYVCAGELAPRTPITILGIGGASNTFLRGTGAGRIFTLTTNAVVDGFTISNGYATTVGGGAYVGAGGLIQNCVIGCSTAVQYGGGLFLARGGTARNCVVENNRALSVDGGGVYLEGGAALHTSVIRSNVAAKGGGIFQASNSLVRTCLIEGNRSTNGNGGGVFTYWNGGVLESSTIVDNESPGGAQSGGGLFCNGQTTIRNTIIYGNRASTSLSNWVNQGGQAIFEHCCTAPSVGTACVTTPPQFDNGPLRPLHFRSPCIEAGTNQTWMTNGVDLASTPRIVGRTTDIGAREAVFAYVSTNGAANAPYACWADAARDLQHALNLSGSGRTVVVGSGVFTSSAPFVVDRGFRVYAWSGPESTVLDGGGTKRVLVLTNRSILAGFTIRNGNASNAPGGGAYVTGQSVLSNCWIVGNRAWDSGGGAHVTWGSRITHARILGNHVLGGAPNSGGGVALWNGYLEHSVCLSNFAAQGGGAAVLLGGGMVFNSIFAGNTAFSYGGGLDVANAGTVGNCTIADNSAGVGAGGLSAWSASAIHNCIAWSNFVGGAHSNVGIYSASVIVSNLCSIPAVGGAPLAADPMFLNVARRQFQLRTGSPAIDSGADYHWMPAVDIDGYPRALGARPDIGAYEMVPIHFVSAAGSETWPYDSWSKAARSVQAAVDSARHGETILIGTGSFRAVGGVVVTQTLRIAAAGNLGTASIDGGGVDRCFHLTTDATLERLVISNGYAAVGGGVFAAPGSGALIDQCRLVGNRAATYGGGAILYANGGRISRCYIADNQALANDGGGIYLSDGAAVHNSIVVGNQAGQNGGGIFGYLSCTVLHCTVVGNSGISGGGVHFYNDPPGIPLVRNSIVYFNSGSIGRSNWYSNGDAILDHNLLSPVAPGGNIDANPLFENAGARDFRLRAGSPAIDAGINDASAGVDVAFMWRPLDGDGIPGSVADIGAYEFYNALGDSNTNGLFDGWEQQYFGSPFSSADPGADPDADGVINRDESFADTHPFDPDSALRLSEFWRSGAVWRFRVESTSLNRQYLIEVSTNLSSGVWQPGEEGVQPGTGGALEFKEPGASGSPFFGRARVLLP